LLPKHEGCLQTVLLSQFYAFFTSGSAVVNNSFLHPALVKIPGTVKLCESSGRAGGFPIGLIN